MAPSINVINILLLATIIASPVLYYSICKVNTWYLDEIRQDIVRYWLYFLLLIVILRAFVGISFMLTGGELAGIAKTYPIRIAYPNYELLHGLPYLLICIVTLFNIRRISYYIKRSHWRYPLLWCFAVVLLLSFGGIHGGLITGNLGIANSVTHLADASINATAAETFATHIDRVAGNITPAYQAPHSTSHPAASIVYWQLILNYLSPFSLSVINVMTFSLAFPIIFWALCRRLDEIAAFQSTLVCLILPALLIYGRSDDALHYGLAAIIMALTYVALSESRFGLTVAAALLLFVAMNFTYAALIILPAMYAFNSDVRLNEIFAYIKRILPHFAISVAVISLLIYIVSKTYNFSLLDSFYASVQYNAGSNIVALIDLEKYARVINDRIMAINDFLIFGGPLFLYFLMHWFRGWNKNFINWRLKNVALFVLLFILVINSNGPGEVSRPWGSLYLLIVLCWIADFLSKQDQATRWWIIKIQFAWALTLQIPLNFGW